MALIDTNFVIGMSPLDPAFSGNLQEFADHMVRRMVIQSPTGFYTVIVSDTKPLSDQGLLLLGGTKLYAWDVNTAQYEPADIADSLGINPTGKYIFTTDDGTLEWKLNTDFFTWAGFSLTNIPAGAAGTIAYSNGAVFAWGTPATALPDASVPVGKLLATTAENGMVPTVTAGVVGWAAPASTVVHWTSPETVLPTVAGTAGEVAITLPATITTRPGFSMVYKCVSTDGTWAAGDVVDSQAIIWDNGANRVPLIVRPTATHIYLMRPAGTTLWISKKTDGTDAAVDTTKWVAIVDVYQ